MNAEIAGRAGFIREGTATVERIDSRLLTGETTYLFNIYRLPHTVNLGTVGMWYIQPCPEGQEYVRASQSVPGTVVENYPAFTDTERYPATLNVGEDVVRCILGIGIGQGPEEDLRRFGVFASKHQTPTKSDLATAKAILLPYLQSVIAEGLRFFTSADPKMRESVNEKHYMAARYLNVKPAFMHSSDFQEMSNCPFCSIPIRPNASICPGCSQIVNQAAYEATKKAIGAVA